MKPRKWLMAMLLLVVAAVIHLPGVANASVVLTFDDLSPSYTPAGSEADDINSLATDYGGFSWSGSGNDFWGVITNESYTQSAYGNTLEFPSMANALINEYDSLGASVLFTSSSPFNFEGAYFAPWTKNDDTVFYGASSLTINGYSGGSLVATETFNLIGGPLTWVDVNIDDVDTLEFLPSAGSQGGTYFLMDNFTYTAVPIPGAVWLFISGGLAMAGVRKRFVK